MGNEAGAGEAWKLAPAKAVAEMVLAVAVPEWGGVRRPGLVGPGDVETLVGRGLLLDFLLADFELEGWVPGAGAGLARFDFMGGRREVGRKGHISENIALGGIVLAS